MLLRTVLLLMLAAGTQAQSGCGDSDMEPTVYCTSHISSGEGCNITCQLVTNECDLEDDEDDESDAIEKMTACCCELFENKKRCADALGETLSSKVLNPIAEISLTVHLKGGHKIEKTLNLRKIIKPKTPQVCNVTFTQDKAVIYIQTPYHNDYLKLENQQFQLQLWSAQTNKTQNTTSDTMNIAMNHLSKDPQYHVKVRAIPVDYYQGTWSEWSQTYSFTSPYNDMVKHHHNRVEPHPDIMRDGYHLIWIVIPMVVVVLSGVFLWKNRILTYMWPSIPHPKNTLVQICKPNNGLLLKYNPDEFSALNFYPMDLSEGQVCGETQSVLSALGAEDTPSCSTQSTDSIVSNSSVRTEEMELLSGSSLSEEEQSIQSTGQSLEDATQRTEAPQTTQAEHSSPQYEPVTFALGQQDDSYVTMSSFYQIKSFGTVNMTDKPPQIH